MQRIRAMCRTIIWQSLLLAVAVAAVAKSVSLELGGLRRTQEGQADVESTDVLARLMRSSSDSSSDSITDSTSSSSDLDSVSSSDLDSASSSDLDSASSNDDVASIEDSYISSEDDVILVGESIEGTTITPPISTTVTPATSTTVTPATSATVEPSTTATTTSTTAQCFPGQTCETVDALAQGPGGSNEATAGYDQAFTAFSPALFLSSVLTLFRELSGETPLSCARDVTDLSPLVQRLAQSSGTGIVDFIFPAAIVPGGRRTLSSAVVQFTLPNLGTFGDLQLQFNFDSDGVLASTDRLIRPPRQSTDLFFPFPVNQVVCTPDPTVCVAEMPTPPVQLLVPDPLPSIDPNEVQTLLVPRRAFGAQCA